MKPDNTKYLASPLLKPPSPHEHKPAFFGRFASMLDPRLFSPAHFFDRHGLYIYKRPVRTASSEHAALLSSAGSLFHHVVVYVKRPDGSLFSMEFGPNDAMDVTTNPLEHVAPGPILSTSPEAPDPQYLPMLHVDYVIHHDHEHDVIKEAIDFASKQQYNVIECNCIAFSDFVTRILTNGAVKNVPLIYDHLVGTVPSVDNPMLSTMLAMMGMNWFDVTDGSRLVEKYLTLRTKGKSQSEGEGEGSEDVTGVGVSRRGQENNNKAGGVSGLPCCRRELLQRK